MTRPGESFLHPASVGVYAGMVFVNPSPQRDSNLKIDRSMNDRAAPTYPLGI